MRTAGVLAHGLCDDRRRHQIGESIAAEQQRRVRLERIAQHVDEPGVVGLVPLRAYVAVHLVAPGMLHRVALGQFPRVLPLAHRRVIRCQFFDAPGTKLVQPCIAHVADDHVAVVDDGGREDAGHALLVRVQRRQAEDFVVGEPDRFAYAILDPARFALEPRPDQRERRVRGLLASRLSADAVDDQEDAAD